MPEPIAGRIGVPVPGVELKVEPVGDRLEARVRGPNITPGYWRDPEGTRAAFDEDGFYAMGDAIGLVDPSDPSRGFTFQGRIAEDFKLSTGTWVRVGPLRAALLAHFSDLVQDVVIAGHDRDDLAMLVFPNLSTCRVLAGAAGDAPARDVLEHAAVTASFTAALASFAAARTGTSIRVDRAILLEQPPSIDAQEITDKGSLNQRAVLAARRPLVEQLYGAAGTGLLIDVSTPERTRMIRPVAIQLRRPHRDRRARPSRSAADAAAADAAARAYFGDSGAVRDRDGLAEYYRSRRMACVVFSVDERLSGRPQLSNDEVADFAAANPDIAIAFASIDPNRGADGVREARRLVSEGRVRGPEAAPAAPAVRTQRSDGVSALRGLRRGAPAGPVPHRPQRHRHRHARRRRRPAEIRQSDADRRRGRRFSRPADHHGASVVPVAGRSDLDLPAQADVYIDLSGWSPKYFSPTLVQYANTLLKRKVLFGSDYPWLTPDRWLADFQTTAIREEVRPLILKENAVRLLFS